jgi:hypothetical protein
MPAQEPCGSGKCEVFVFSSGKQLLLDAQLTPLGFPKADYTDREPEIQSLEDMEQHNWALRAIMHTPAPVTASQIDAMQYGGKDDRDMRRDSITSITATVNYFEEIDMSNWAFGPMYGP